MGFAHCETRKTVKTRNISEILLRCKEKASQYERTVVILCLCGLFACPGSLLKCFRRSQFSELDGKSWQNTIESCLTFCKRNIELKNFEGQLWEVVDESRHNWSLT